MTEFAFCGEKYSGDDDHQTADDEADDGEERGEEVGHEEAGLDLVHHHLRRRTEAVFGPEHGNHDLVGQPT